MLKRRMPIEHKLILLCARLKINSRIQQEIKEIISSQMEPPGLKSEVHRGCGIPEAAQLSILALKGKVFGRESINWSKIIEKATRQEVFPFLYYSLNKAGLLNFIPEDIFAEIKNYYYANLKRNLRIEKEIFNLLELTSRLGISVIPFKGFNLMLTLYPNPGLRAMVDVDLLVKENEFEKIRCFLSQRVFYDNLETVSKEYLQNHEICFSKILLPNLPLHIEIHCSLVPARPRRIDLPHLWQRAQEITVHNQKLLSLSPEDTFLSLVLHLRRHTRRLTLKFIVDIAELLNTNRDKLDWAYIKESARINHIVSLIYSSLYLAKELLEANVSPKILNEFRPNIIKSALIHFTINKYNFFTLKKRHGIFLRLLLFDSPIDFLLYLWRVSFLERFLTKQYFKKQKRILQR